MSRTRKCRQRRQAMKEHAPDIYGLRECPQHKLAYPTRNKAQFCAAVSRKHGMVLRPYKCPHCKMWHLTSQV